MLNAYAQQSKGFDLQQEEKQSYSAHPYCLYRIAGEPINLLELLEDSSTAEYIVYINSKKEFVLQEKKRLCEIIETKVPGLEDISKTRALIKTKRSFFNDKPVSESVLLTISDLFNKSELNLIESYNKALNQIKNIPENLQCIYEKELENTAECFEKIWCRTNFKNAIAYTNDKLHRDFIKIIDKDKKIKNKKKRVIEDTFVRYLTRTISKISPLSSFTPICVSRLEKHDDTNTRISIEPSVNNKVSIKSSLFNQIVYDWLEKYDAASNIINLKLNPSISEQDGTISFIKRHPGNTVGGRTWGTGESNTVVKGGKFIDSIIEYFKASPNQSLSKKDLIQSVLKGSGANVTEVAVERAIKELAKIGLLVFDTGLKEQDDLLDWGRRVFLKEKALGSQVRRALDKLDLSLKLFSTANDQDRIRLQIEIESSLSEFSSALGVKASENMTSPMFFENSYVTRNSAGISRKGIDNFSEELDTLLQLSHLVDPNVKNQLEMRDYFVSRFGATGECHDVRQFVEDYIKFSENKKSLPQKDLLKGETLTKLLIAKRAWYKLVGTAIKENQTHPTHHLDLSAVHELIESVPTEIANRSVSQSFLGQFLCWVCLGVLVLNQVFPGRSRLSSRFLEVLNKEEIEDIKQYLKEGTIDGIAATLPGVFGFNANYHPNLCEYELDINPYPNDRKSSKKLSLDNLSLVVDKKTDKLFLKGKDGKLVDVWYQGFLTPALLPPIQKKLAGMMEGQAHYLTGAIALENILVKGIVNHIPRVCLGKIVLSRETFIIPRKLLPNPDKSPAEFFMEVQEWKNTQKLPNEIFSRFVPLGKALLSSDDNETGINNSIKNMKPFYVKLDSPRLVRLFQKAMQSNDYPAVLTELLPKFDDANVLSADEKHVSEIMFELTLPALR